MYKITENKFIIDPNILNKFENLEKTEQFYKLSTYLSDRIVSLKVIGNQVGVTVDDELPPMAYVKLVHNTPLGPLAEIDFTRGRLEAYNFDKNCNYPVNANLFVKDGLLTTKSPTTFATAIGVVIVPPDGINPKLDFLWL